MEKGKQLLESQDAESQKEIKKELIDIQKQLRSMRESFEVQRGELSIWFHESSVDNYFAKSLKKLVIY